MEVKPENNLYVSGLTNISHNISIRECNSSLNDSSVVCIFNQSIAGIKWNVPEPVGTTVHRKSANTQLGYIQNVHASYLSYSSCNLYS